MTEFNSASYIGMHEDPEYTVLSRQDIGEYRHTRVSLNGEIEDFFVLIDEVNAGNDLTVKHAYLHERLGEDLL
jgi:hypothetical protein